MLLRGEIVWQKGDGASGSCAWGSFRSPVNPVISDITERVIIASEGRFDRALGVTERARRGLPHESSLTSDEFMAATLDLWEIAPESARRVDHPATFPVELPERLIQLNTFVGDLVLDPFMGSGSTLVAAVRTGRRYVGYDLEQSYVSIPKERVDAEIARLAEDFGGPRQDPKVLENARSDETHRTLAEEAIEESGFAITRRNVRIEGLRVDVVAEDKSGVPWIFVITGALTAVRGGLSRTEILWRALGVAFALARRGVGPVVLVTSRLPRRSSEGDLALRLGGPSVVFDALSIASGASNERLATYAHGGHEKRPLPGFWSEEELSADPA